jgi:hypothetical protein
MLARCSIYLTRSNLVGTTSWTLKHTTIAELPRSFTSCASSKATSSRHDRYRRIPLILEVMQHLLFGVGSQAGRQAYGDEAAARTATARRSFGVRRPLERLDSQRERTNTVPADAYCAPHRLLVVTHTHSGSDPTTLHMGYATRHVSA